MRETGYEAGSLGARPVRNVTVNDDVVVVELAGELDLYTAEELRTALHTAASTAPIRLVVDLSEVRFVDSTTLGVLVEARRRLPNRRGFLLAGAGRDVRRTLEVSGLDRHFVLFDSVDAALDAKL